MQNLCCDIDKVGFSGFYEGVGASKILFEFILYEI